MEFRDKFFGAYFLRNAGREEQLAVYSKRLRSVEITSVIMGILALIYMTASKYAIGLDQVIYSLWVPMPMAEYMTWNTDFAVMMSHVADICKIGLYIGFCWGCRNTLMHIFEVGYVWTYHYITGIQEFCKSFLLVPLFGWAAVIMLYIASWGSMILSPLVYLGLAIFAGMPLWPIIALIDHSLIKRKIRKLENAVCIPAKAF